MSVTERNHYIPQLYLRQFTNDNGLIHAYRILVSKEQVPAWKTAHIAAVGYQRHLYTQAIFGGQSDAIEAWLERDFESPAAPVLRRAASDERLTRDDYTILARFTAAQIVRTPAFLVRNLPRWRKQASAEIQKTVDKIPQFLRGEVQPNTTGLSLDDQTKAFLPFRIIKEPLADGKTVAVKLETAVGRGYWFFAMKHLLGNTWKRLAAHRWTILRSNPELPLFTSDDPVMLINFKSVDQFDFGGGWGSPGSEIILPISPTHALYTQIDRSVPQRGTLLSIEHNIIMRNLIARHAHRYIFAREQDSGVTVFRPRHVDADAFEREKHEWAKWQVEQSAIEREFSVASGRWHTQPERLGSGDGPIITILSVSS